MRLEFFSLSDVAFKYRRNLLFVCCLCFTHFNITPLTEMKVFNVQIPEKLLSLGIPACLSWFALNYFYCLYAEYVEWKATHIEELETMSQEISFERVTVIPDVAVYTDKRTELRLSFDTSINYGSPQSKSDTRLSEETEKLMNITIENQLKIIAADMMRIDLFRSAISRYQVANKLRFYILDFLVPMLFSIYCFYLVASTFVYLQVSGT